MKILEAELKNFGNFVDEKLSFHDGINVVWAKNGAGKSTIHEFILAMFYGLKGEECIRWRPGTEMAVSAEGCALRAAKKLTSGEGFPGRQE